MSATPVGSTAHFENPRSIAGYADRTRRLVPGWADLQTMAALLLAERVPEQGQVLVVGAGGGVELKVFAQRYPEWRFVGVDPAKAMLDMAEAALGPLLARVRLHCGYVESAPIGPFDAATCLLTMHFVDLDERRRMLKEIRRRLKPGAPFVMAHLSFPQAPDEKDAWLSRYVAFAISSGIEAESVRNAASEIASRLTLLDPEAEVAMLEEAGFTNADQFYAGFTFRGWVSYA